MSILPLVYAPNEIFKKTAVPVTVVNDEIEKAVGLGANMVGVLKRIIVVDLKKKEGLSLSILFQLSFCHSRSRRESMAKRLKDWIPAWSGNDKKG